MPAGAGQAPRTESAPRADRSAFVWPPRSRAAPPPPPPPPAADPQTRSPGAAINGALARTAHLFACVERAWLGLDAEPFGVQRLRAHWSADGRDAFCDRCGASIGPYEANEFGCGACRRKRPPYERVVRLSTYDGELERWIAEVKFDREWRIGEALGRELGRQIRAIAGESGFGADARSPAVVPLPTTFRRRMVRGIDHALCLARGVSRELDAPVVRALARSHRPSQRAVSASARAANVRGSFRLRARHARFLKGRVVLLVDDVMTSGSTLRAAAWTIRKALPTPERGAHPPRIWACVGAVAELHSDTDGMPF